jgi:hypothetical protein
MPEAIAAMRQALKRIEEAISRGLIGTSADVEFHMAVARASDNEFFEAVMQSMRMPMEFAINLARSLTLARPLEHLRAVQTEHVTMFEAIEARDKDARGHMRAHIEDACADLRRAGRRRIANGGAQDNDDEDAWGYASRLRRSEADKLSRMHRCATLSSAYDAAPNTIRSGRHRSDRKTIANVKMKGRGADVVWSNRGNGHRRSRSALQGLLRWSRACRALVVGSALG